MEKIKLKNAIFDDFQDKYGIGYNDNSIINFLLLGGGGGVKLRFAFISPGGARVVLPNIWKKCLNL